MDQYHLPSCWHETFFLYLIFPKTSEIKLGMPATIVLNAEKRGSCFNSCLFCYSLIRGAIKIWMSLPVCMIL